MFICCQLAFPKAICAHLGTAGDGPMEQVAVARFQRYEQYAASAHGGVLGTMSSERCLTNCRSGPHENQLRPANTT